MTASDDAIVAGLIERAFGLRARVEVALARVGLTYAEYRVLSEIGVTDNAIEAASGVSDGLGGSDRAAVLHDLLTRGLIVGDARALDGIALTRLGSVRVAEGAVQVDSIASEFLDVYDPVERTELHDVLDRIRSAFG